MVRCHRVIDATSVYGALDPERDRNSMNYSGTRIARSSPPACNDAWNGKDASPERKGVQENGAGSDKSLPIITVDIADIPGGGQLHLLQCGTEFSIQFGDDELMGSRDHESEKALARLTQERLVQRDGNILIGGLGMGFTLGAALDAWSQSAIITVAELVPKIISWANGPLMHLFGTNLTDPRVRIQLADVFDVITHEKDRFDAILLDVDNGPDGFIRKSNDRLYSTDGLEMAYAALKPGGLLSIWSAYSDDAFAERLEQAGFCLDEILLPAFSGSAERWHNIWFAAKAGA